MAISYRFDGNQRHSSRTVVEEWHNRTRKWAVTALGRASQDSLSSVATVDG